MGAQLLGEELRLDEPAHLGAQLVELGLVVVAAVVLALFERGDGRLGAEDLRAALDVELSALPARLRTPLILCYLDGLTRDEAATRLGCSLRTLHRRLDEGRQRLRDRLVRRGLAPVMLGAAALTADGLRAALDLEPKGSAIVSLEVSPRTAERVAATGITTATRDGRMRAAFHLYNTVEDIDRLVKALR